VTIIRRLPRLILALFLLLGLGLVTTQPASAAGIDDIKVCNSSASYTLIRVYKTDNSYSNKLYAGDCTAWINDTGSNPVRVATYNTYAIGIEGQGYGQCHSGGNPDSNPPSGEYPNYVKYRTTDAGYCPWLI
jgi:hypothetical protein